MRFTVSEFRPVFRHKERAHIDALVFEEGNLHRETAAVSGEAAVRSDNAMTGDDDGDGVVPDGAADGLRGHAGLAGQSGNLARERTVGSRRAVGDAAEQIPYSATERAPARGEGEFCDCGALSREVPREPRLCPYEERRLALLYALPVQIGHVVLPRDPEADQRTAAFGDQDIPERGCVMRGKDHPITSRGIFHVCRHCSSPHESANQT